MATVTAIKQQKRNPNRVSIYLDGEYAFPLAKIVAAWLKVGQEVGQEKILALQTQDQGEKAFQRALNFISYRPRSQAEVERNLRKHEVDEDVIGEVVDRLTRSGLLNDEDFARRWVEDRGAFRPRGAYALRVELRRKGLADASIEGALAGLEEAPLAMQAAQRKLRQLASLEWPEFRSKLGSHLSRRGFGYETVMETCKAAWEQVQTQSSNS